MKIAEVVTALGNWLGKRAEKKLKKKYPHGLEGIVSDIFLTRGKVINSFSNVTARGYKLPELITREKEGIYEVVYQATLSGHEKEFILSLFPYQTCYITLKVKITEYSCVAHPLHRFYLSWKAKRKVKSSVEVYPSKMVHITEDGKEVTW